MYAPDQSLAALGHHGTLSGGRARTLLRKTVPTQVPAPPDPFGNDRKGERAGEAYESTNEEAEAFAPRA
jgi:hypothetical protein